MTYSLDYSGGGDNSFPEFTGYRFFWSKSYAGAYVSYYDAGVALGKADLSANNSTNFNALDSVEARLRDPTWDAKVDGYTDATRTARGPNKFRM